MWLRKSNSAVVFLSIFLVEKTAVKMSKDSVEQSIATGVHIKMSHAPHTYRKRNLFSAHHCRLPRWPVTTRIIPTLNALYNITSMKSMYILSQHQHLCPAGKSQAHHRRIFIILYEDLHCKQRISAAAITFSVSAGCWPPVGEKWLRTRSVSMCSELIAHKSKAKRRNCLKWPTNLEPETCLITEQIQGTTADSGGGRLIIEEQTNIDRKIPNTSLL